MNVPSTDPIFVAAVLVGLTIGLKAVIMKWFRS